MHFLSKNWQTHSCRIFMDIFKLLTNVLFGGGLDTQDPLVKWKFNMNLHYIKCIQLKALFLIEVSSLNALFVKKLANSLMPNFLDIFKLLTNALFGCGLDTQDPLVKWKFNMNLHSIKFI